MADWASFCAHFPAGQPKQLDLELRGPLDGSPKDVTLPSARLYERTRFSLVFESVVSAPGDQDHFPYFLTEKVGPAA